MNLKELFQTLSGQNIELWVEGDKLRYRAAENALTPELLAVIKQYKTEIISWLSQPSQEIETYPLSHGQKALWFLYQLAPESAAYNLTYSAKLADNVDIHALQKAAQALVNRHESLRTTFTTVNGEPIQQIHQHQTVEFTVENAFALNQTEINNWLLEKSAVPFNLETGSIIRFNLLVNNKAKKENILLITQHHITGDFWSLGIILEDLQAFYEAIVKDKEPLLPEKRSEYRDYIQWSEEILAGEYGQQLGNYWQEKLAGELPLVNLPTDKLRPQKQTYTGNSLIFNLESNSLQKLQTLAKKERVSLYMVLLTAFQILLCKYTNQEDILIGSPTVNRSRPEFENIIGYFTNPVVLRGDLSGNPTVSQLLAKTRLCVLEALENQEYPFPLLVEKLQPVRDASRTPIYQVAFAWDRVNQSEQEFTLLDNEKLITEPIILGSKGAAFDLTLSVTNEADSLIITWNYNTDLFASNTIKRISGHFVTLLEAIVENSQIQISQLQILTAAEKQKLLREWNHTATEYPDNKCIHQIFAEQVEKTPNAIAVVYGNEQLTYLELNQKANQLAHYLISLGVQADSLVGISVERSPEMIVGILGILKAGAAYVPLDPEYPQERLITIVEDAQIKLLLTTEKLVNNLPVNQTQIILYDQELKAIESQSQENPHTLTKTENLAYVIYTSGSTGKPKGVSVTHKGVNRLVINTNYIQIEPKDNIAQVSNSAFDAATFEIWGALLTGAKLVGISKQVALSTREFVATLKEQNISILFLTTALFNQIAQTEPTAFSTLRYLLFGGEAVDTKWVQEIVKKGKPEHLLHVYGPTENTTFTSWFLVEEVANDATTIPIGKPISNTEIYILDHNLQPVPVGVPGELHIGGAGLARGYLNRSELTTQTFIDNPFDNGKTKLYKTGDLVKYLADGNIEYIGRIDNQVKIRGFRIELGEIETALNQNAEIQTSCVIVREDNPGNKRLVAYIVSDKTQAVSELRQYLQGRLPEYMIPNAFVYLESLPLTLNGKVDRRALPVPSINTELADNYVAPSTPTEEILTAIWAQILEVEVEQIGIKDNFFELGGHSLLATKLVSRIRESLQIEIPLQTVFVAATVEEQALFIEQAQKQNLQIIYTEITPREEHQELPLSYAQQRLWFLDKLEQNSATYNIPAVLKIAGSLDKLALENSFLAIVNRHESLRTNFREVNGKAQQIINKNLEFTVAKIDLKNLAAEVAETTAREIIQEQAKQPFDLAKDTLIRATLIEISDTENLLLICMHHIISDGWSIGVFINELSEFYNNHIQGKETELKPLPIQYADFGIWQKNWLQG
ncbi:MAG: amino acid adenylation domain-containing protein, partial [Nostocales cyanobacterium]